MTRSALRSLRLVLAATVSLAAPNAFAQAFDSVRLFAAPPGKDGGTVGAIVVSGAAYAGSNERRTRLLPVLDYQWANGWFAGVSNGVGYNFSTSPRLQYGLRLTADFGRDEKRSAALRGLGDIDTQVEAGAFFNLRMQEGFAFTSSARYGSGRDGKGLVVDLGAGWSTTFGAGWRLGLGTALSVVNAEVMQSTFGITPEQSRRSGYAVYTPGAGLRDTRASLSLSYAFAPRLSATASVSASTLLGDAADSPLVRRKTNASAVFVLGYAF